MSNDNLRHGAATSPDQPRPAAASRDNEFTLSIDEVIDLYAAAGLPRDKRTIQRYCAKGRLEAHRIEIPYGEKYLITPASVDRHIAYIKEVRQAAADHGEPRPAAATPPAPNEGSDEPRQGATGPDQPRPAAADIFDHPYVKRLEAEVDRLNDKYEKQVRRTEEVMLDANKQLIELQQANAIAQSETLAKYMLELRAGGSAGATLDDPAG